MGHGVAPLVDDRELSLVYFVSALMAEYGVRRKMYSAFCAEQAFWLWFDFWLRLLNVRG